MKHPEKWRETADPFQLPFRSFELAEVTGYPHAGNDVFQARGIYGGREVEAYIKVARQPGADIENEIRTIQRLNCPLTPQVIDSDEQNRRFSVTLAKPGERLSMIVGENRSLESLPYMYEYGQTLARLHGTQGDFPPVKDRRFFHIPEKSQLAACGLEFVHEYLTANRPHQTDLCFCHGDFHYANVLWEKGHISAILDFELSGTGCREFDIAWALILRPGQKFLKTDEEINLFREGYSSLQAADWNQVGYYMVQIYSYFYQFSGNAPEYLAHLMQFLCRICGG